MFLIIGTVTVADKLYVEHPEVPNEERIKNTGRNIVKENNECITLFKEI